MGGFVVLVGVVVLVVTAAVFASKTTGFQNNQLFFASGTLSALAAIFVLAMAFYGLSSEGDDGTSPGEDIFQACVQIIPPLATLVIGYYFGSSRGSTDAVLSRPESTEIGPPANTTSPGNLPESAGAPSSRLRPEQPVD